MFELGRLFVAQGILRSAHDMACLASLLARHTTGDWGLVGDIEREQNEASVKHGGIIQSVYVWDAGYVVIRTEADRSITMVSRINVSKRDGI